MGRRKKNRAALKKKRKRAARRLKQAEAEAKHAEAVAAWLTLVQMPEEIIWLIVGQLTFRHDAVNLGLACARLAEVVFCRGGPAGSVRWARKQLGQLRDLYSPRRTFWFADGDIPLGPYPITAGAVIFIARRNRELVSRGSVIRESAWGGGDWGKYWRHITLDAAKWLLSRDLGPWKIGESMPCEYLARSRCFSRQRMRQNPPVWNLLKSRFRKGPRQARRWDTDLCKAMKARGEECGCETRWVFGRGRTLVPFPEAELDPAQQKG